MSFVQFGLSEAYQTVRGLGDRLALMKEQIDWNPFKKMIKNIFYNHTCMGGRPNTNEIVVVRCLLLQAWYGLSDEELEYQINDRLSFRNFVGFPDKVPDFTTIWKIRDQLQKTGTEEKIWTEVQRQLNTKGYEIKQGVIQDASFTEADLGRKRYYKEKKARKKGEKISYTPKQISHIDKDSTFSIKHGQIHYGYKKHIKLDVDHHLIRSYEVTTASLHDSQIDLIKKKDIAAWRDKGYHGTKLKKGIIDHTMKRATKGKKLNGGEQKRNKAISRIRAPGERPFAVIQRVFHGARTLVKTLFRVKIKEMFKCFAYNLYQLVTLKRKELATAL